MTASRLVALGVFLFVSRLLAEVSYEYRPIPIDGGGAIQCVAVSPGNPQIVLAGVDVAGIARSTDGGLSWEMVWHGLERQSDYSLADIAFCPSRPEWVYAAAGTTYGSPENLASTASLFLSRDAGKNWTRISEQISCSGMVNYRQYGRILVVDCRDPMHLWVGTTLHGVRESSDGGKTWIGRGPENIGYISVLVPHCREEKRFFLGAEAVGSREGGFWKSTDGGKSWEKILSSPISDIAVSPDGSVLAAGHRTIVLSRDGGETWQECKKGLPSGEWWNGWHHCSVAADPFIPKQFLLVVFLNEPQPFAQPKVFRLSSPTDSWQAVDTPAALRKVFTPYGRPGKDGWHGFREWFAGGPSHLVFHPTVRGRVYLADWFTVNRSDDGGKTWRACNKGLCTTVALNAVWDRTSPGYAYLGLADIGLVKCRVADDGMLRARSLRDTFAGPHAMVYQFSWGGQTITLAGVNEYFAHNRIYRRVNRGPWRCVYDKSEGTARSEWRQGVVISGDEKTGRLFASLVRIGRILYSADGGATWKNYQDSLLTLSRQDEKKIDPVEYKNGQWWVGVEGKRFQADEPGRWRPSTGDEYDVIIHPAAASLQYRIQRQRPRKDKTDVLLKSEDGGKTWQPIYSFPWCSATGVTLTSSPEVVWAWWSDPWLPTGRGIVVSTNGGKDWTHLPPTPGWGVGGVYPDPRQPTRALVIFNSMGFWLAVPKGK